MKKNNVDTQIEGGLILITNLQWYLFHLSLVLFSLKFNKLLILYNS
jgi:hypothetical protein